MQIRQVRDEEFLKWRIAVRGGLGDHTNPESTVFMRAHRVEIDRLLVCMDGDTMAGSGGADSFDMTLPGGAQVPVAGVALHHHRTDAPTAWHSAQHYEADSRRRARTRRCRFDPVGQSEPPLRSIRLRELDADK